MNKKIMFLTMLSGFLLVGCSNNVNNSSNNNSSDTSTTSNENYQSINVTVLDETDGLVAYDNKIAKIDLDKYFKDSMVNVGQIYQLKIDTSNTYSTVVQELNNIHEIKLISSPEVKENEKLVLFVNRKNYEVTDVENQEITIESMYFPTNTLLETIVNEYDSKHSTKYTTSLNKMYESLKDLTLTKDMSLYSYYLFSESSRN